MARFSGRSSALPFTAVALFFLLACAVCGAWANIDSATEGAPHQHVPWHAIAKPLYGAAVHAGAIRPGLVVDGSHDPSRPTIVFVHGRSGHPGEFAALAAPFRGRANLAALVYDDDRPLAPSAELLRGSLRGLRSAVVVAHSMGALLPIYVGATDGDESLCGLGAVYLNPLIGGSHYVDDIPALRWLGPLEPVLQGLFFPPVVADLAPESRFQQSAFGPSARRSCFAGTTTIVLTEAPGQEPGIRPERVPLFFGATQSQLLRRLGTVLRLEPEGPDPHDEPLRAAISVPLIAKALRDVSGNGTRLAVPAELPVRP